MSRAEDLVLKMADAGLDPAEEAELNALLADPGTAERCWTLVEVEAALRSGRVGEQMPAGVVDQVRRHRDAALERAVMDRVQAPARWVRRLRIAAVAAGLLLAAGLGLFRSGEGSLGRLVDGSPGVVLNRAGRDPWGRELRAGDVLRTGSEPVRFVIDGVAGIRLESYSEVLLDGPRRLVLGEGEVDAEVLAQPPGRPLVIEGPHAKAEVLGTRLKLSAAADATRLEVRTGSVRLVRSEDGAAVVVREREYSLAGDDADLCVRPVPAEEAEAPEVTGFSLILQDSPRSPLPGWEEIPDGAVIHLSKLPTRRVNLRANTRPAKVGSLRFSTEGSEDFRIELTAPYTIVPGNGIKGPTWTPAPGLHRVTATPFTGTYGNGERGRSRTLTFTIAE